MNTQQLREYVLRKLGHPQVVVELTTPQIDDAIQDALDKFNQYMYKGEPRVEKNRAGAVHIPLQAGDRAVVFCKILFPEDTRVYAQMNIFEIMYRMVFPRMPLGDWYMLKSYYKQYQRVRGTDPDWYVDESDNSLYVDCWSGPYDIFYVVARDLKAEDFAGIKSPYEKDFKDLVLAEAKLTLGKIRGKFANTIPVPGGALQTDASELKQEGTSVKEALEVKLDKIARFSTSPIMWT